MPEGALADFISDLEQGGRLRGTDIANLTGTSKATVSRWRSGAAKPQPRNELILADLHYVVRRLEDYYTPEDIRLWLYAPHPQLDGRRAIDLIHDQQTEAVLQVLNRLDAEAYI